MVPTIVVIASSLPTEKHLHERGYQLWYAKCYYYFFFCDSMWLAGNNKTLPSLFYTSFSTPYGTLVGTHTNSYVNQKETCRVVASHLNFVPSEKEKKFHENNI